MLVAELSEFEKLDAETKDAFNATNRQGTQVKNAFKAYVKEEDLDPADEIHMGERAYAFDVTHNEQIDPAGLYKLFKAGKLKEEEFLGAISVPKTNAEKWIGPHILLKITEIVDGKELGLRKRDLDAPVKAPTLVRKSKPVPQKQLLRSTDAPPKPIIKMPGKLSKPVRRILVK